MIVARIACSGLVVAVLAHIAWAAPRSKSLRKVDWRNHAYPLAWGDGRAVGPLL